MQCLALYIVRVLSISYFYTALHFFFQMFCRSQKQKALDIFVVYRYFKSNILNVFISRTLALIKPDAVSNMGIISFLIQCGCLHPNLKNFVCCIVV